MTVRGNGTCWLYAVMAALGVLQHANPKSLRSEQEEKIPTDGDYDLSAVFLSKMQVAVTSMNLPQGAKDLEGKTIATKEHPSCTCWGGGETDYAVLSYLLECNILKLDQANPSKTSLYSAGSKGRVKYLTEEGLKLHLAHAVEHGEPNLVVEFNGHYEGGGHFAAYESPQTYMPDHPLWLTNILRKRPIR